LLTCVDMTASAPLVHGPSTDLPINRMFCNSDSSLGKRLLIDLRFSHYLSTLHSIMPKSSLIKRFLSTLRQPSPPPTGILQNAQNTDAHGSTFNDVGRDQVNLNIINNNPSTNGTMLRYDIRYIIYSVSWFQSC